MKTKTFIFFIMLLLPLIFNTTVINYTALNQFPAHLDTVPTKNVAFYCGSIPERTPDAYFRVWVNYTNGTLKTSKDFSTNSTTILLQDGQYYYQCIVISEDGMFINQTPFYFSVSTPPAPPSSGGSGGIVYVPIVLLTFIAAYLFLQTFRRIS